MKTSTYEQQAIDFAVKHGVKLTIGKNPKYGKYFIGDKNNRYIFSCKLERNGNVYKFKFGQSIANGSKNPTMYDVLACLTKYDVGTLDDFCDEFGYSSDSRTALKTYKAVRKEYIAMELLFGDIIEELQEIS